MSLTLSTNDLRGNSIDAKRHSDSTEKWKPKWESRKWASLHDAQKAGVRIDGNGAKRPPRYTSPRVTEAWRKSNAKQAHRAGSARKQDPLLHRAGTAQYARKQDRFADDEDLTSDSEDGLIGDSQGSPSPKMEDDIAYSYDSAGPASGSQILDIVLTQAVDKFEDKQTTKLVKDEYEVLDIGDNGDEYTGNAADDEDGFELV